MAPLQLIWGCLKRRWGKEALLGHGFTPRRVLRLLEQEALYRERVVDELVAAHHFAGPAQGPGGDGGGASGVGANREQQQEHNQRVLRQLMRAACEVERRQQQQRGGSGGGGAESGLWLAQRTRSMC